MTACIVGWSHTPFGRHEAEDVESLIVKVATGCGRRRRTRPGRHRRDRARPLRRRLQRPGLHQLARAPGRRRLALQAGDPRGERLRHRLGGDPPGAEVDRGRPGALRARGRGREDDRPAGAGDREGAAVRRLPQGGERDRGRLCRRVRPDRPALLPAARRPERRARDHRRQEPQERLRQPACPDAEGPGLRVLPPGLRQKPAGRRAAEAHRLLAGLGRRSRPGADRRRDGARHEQGGGVPRRGPGQRLPAHEPARRHPVRRLRPRPGGARATRPASASTTSTSSRPTTALRSPS